MSEQSKFVSQTEQYHCPCCDGAIARECVSANIRTQDLSGTFRDVKVWCDHCGKLFVAKFVLRNGQWEQDGKAVEATEKQREGFLRRLDHLRGNKYAEAMAG